MRSALHHVTDGRGQPMAWQWMVTGPPSTTTVMVLSATTSALPAVASTQPRGGEVMLFKSVLHRCHSYR